MSKLLFGISGLPIGDGNTKFTYASGIEYLHNIGLDAMELPFVRSINVTDKNRPNINAVKKSTNFYLSAHGSYFINLNAKEDEKIVKSIERIENAAALASVGGKSLIFHPGYYLKSSREDTYLKIKANLEKLKYIGVDFRLETTGKPTQFGSLEELVSLCSEISTCKLCIDFSHLHARDGGRFKNYSDFSYVLEYIGNKLGESSLKDLHIHMSGINYGIKGEKNHLPFKESDFDYVSCLKALKSFAVNGFIICESPILEIDALLLKEIYNSI